MSWAFTAEVSREDALADLTARARGYAFDQQGGVEAEHAAAEQASRAVLAAVDLIEAGAVADVNDITDARFFVSLSGHANPAHRKRDGWANDVVTVSVGLL